MGTNFGGSSFLNEELPEFDFHEVNSFDTLNHCKPIIPFSWVYFCIKARLSRPTWCWPCRGCQCNFWMGCLRIPSDSRNLLYLPPDPLPGWNIEKHMVVVEGWHYMPSRIESWLTSSKGPWTMVPCWLCATVEARLGEKSTQVDRWRKEFPWCSWAIWTLAQYW